MTNLWNAPRGHPDVSSYTLDCSIRSRYDDFRIDTDAICLERRSGGLELNMSDIYILQSAFIT
jgi:hypothetical protein